MRLALLLSALVLLSQVPAPIGGYKASVVVFAVESSTQAYEVFRPYLSQMQLWACEPDGWGDRWNHVYYGDEGGLPAIVEYYYSRAADHLRRNELEKASRYLAYALSYLLDAYNPFNTHPGADQGLAERYREFLDANIESMLSRLGSGSLEVETRSPREIVEEAARLSRGLYPELEGALRKGDYERVYEIAFSLVEASVEGCLSLISQLPLSALERALNTPMLREVFYASLAVMAVSAAYIAYQKAAREEEVEAIPSNLP